MKDLQKGFVEVEGSAAAVSPIADGGPVTRNKCCSKLVMLEQTKSHEGSATSRNFWSSGRFCRSK